MDDADARDLERRVRELEATVAKLPRQIPFYGSGGDAGFIRGTKAEIDAKIISLNLTPPDHAWATDLERYYHLLPSGNAYAWVAWSFLE
jgi:hypothetical protein